MGQSGCWGCGKHASFFWLDLERSRQPWALPAFSAVIFFAYRSPSTTTPRSTNLTPSLSSSSSDAIARLAEYGRNELAEKKKSKLVILGKLLISPMAIALWIAIVVELGEQNGRGERGRVGCGFGGRRFHFFFFFLTTHLPPPHPALQDWIDVALLAAIQFANAGIAFYETVSWFLWWMDVNRLRLRSAAALANHCATAPVVYITHPATFPIHLGQSRRRGRRPESRPQTACHRQARRQVGQHRRRRTGAG